MMILKLAILGAGNVAESYIRQIRRLREEGLHIELVAICNRTAAKAERLAVQFGIAEHGTNYADLLARQDIAGIIILTPMEDHYDHVRQALEAGKHVLVEKTLAPNADIGGSLVRLAKSRELCLVVAPFTTLSPTFRAARSVILEGTIGSVRSARAIYGWSGPDWSPWFHEKDAGPLRDLGVYALTTLTGLLGPVTSVFAQGRSSAPSRGIDNFQISLGFSNDCIGVLTTGFVQQKYKASGIEIYGDSGTLQFIGQDWDPKGHEVWINSNACWQQFEAPYAWPWTDGVRDFAESILSLRSPQAHPSHALHVLEIIDQAYASMASGRLEAIQSIFDPPAFSHSSHANLSHTSHNPLKLT